MRHLEELVGVRPHQAIAEYLRDRYTPPDESVPIQRLTEDDGSPMRAYIAHESDFRVLYARFVPFVDIDLPEATVPARSAIISNIDRYAKRHPKFGGRLYCTAAGLRLIVTNEPIEAAGDDAVEMMEELNADPRYVELCRVERHYAARLDPKPERLTGVGPWAATQFLWCFGNPEACREALPIIAIHDVATKAHSERRLA